MTQREKLSVLILYSMVSAYLKISHIVYMYVYYAFQIENYPLPKSFSFSFAGIVYINGMKSNCKIVTNFDTKFMQYILKIY